MPIQTNLSVSPYFDDFNEQKQYYQVLFKPGVAIQTRELNVLQTIFQNQIERFGDNIFTKGSIVSGCNFQYYPNYPYVKILDTQVNGSPVTPSSYVGLYATSASKNLVSTILAANTGYVSQAPNLNTLFVRYTNSGNTGVETAYNHDDVLTIYDANNSIFQVNVPVGGTGAGFANTDSIVFLSALNITNTSANIATIAAAIANGYTITDPVSSARAIITDVNTIAIANTLVIKIKPYQSDLTTSTVTANAWTFNTGNTIQIYNGVTLASTVTVNSIIGFSANAVPVTDGTGKLISAIMVSQGNGYVVAPYTTIKTANASANIGSLTSNVSAITAQNYKCQVTVSSTAAAGSSPPTGMGYAFGVTEGVIYQKGYFLKVNPQAVVVSSYSNAPDSVVIGFNTSESIINSNIDTSLLDNSTGTLNTLAPGADRLMLTPTLTVLSAATAAANTTFFPITAFSKGMPYLQNQQTQYNVIGDSMAQRTYAATGNFVLDPFLLSTKTANLDSSSSSASQANSFIVAIDPGEAYISGYRVKTNTNYYLRVDQGIDTANATNISVNLNYGNYLTVNEIGGVFNYTTGDYVTLYDTVKQFLTNATNYSTGNTTPAGTPIGTARIRSMVPLTGNPGTPSYQSRLYLFDINMFPGKNIQNAKSVAYSNTFAGVADIVLTNSPALNANIAAVQNAATSTMIFPHGVRSTNATSNINFTYKGLFTGGTGAQGNVTINTSTGIVSMQLGSHIFPYGNGVTLSDAQLSLLDLVFHSSNSQATSNTTNLGFVTTSGSNTLTVNGTSTATTSSVNAGDYLKIFTTLTGEIKRVTAIVNSSVIQVDSNIATSNNSANVATFFPQNVPIQLNGRLAGDRTANVSSNGSLLTISLGKPITFAGTANATLMTSVVAVNQGVTNKVVNRDTVVVLNISNSTFGNTGPWALGVPDIFRLKKVYKDVNTNILSVAANVAASVPSTWVDVTNQFFIDHKQNPDYYDIGYLTLKPTSTLAVNNGDALVVQFDNFTVSGSAGIFTKSSYSANDQLTSNTLVSTSSTNIHTHEIPELTDAKGKNYDLIDHVDFRTIISNTAVSTNKGNTQLATVNPIDYGSLKAYLAGNAAYISGNSYVTNIDNTATIQVGMGVNTPLAGVWPSGTKVLAIINTTAVNLSSTAAFSNTQVPVYFTGDTVKYSSLTPTTFPIDGQPYTSTVQYYQGRVDRIVIDKTGKIKTLRGTPGNDNLSPPPEPKDNLTINLLYIPPYPSVPQKKDSNYINIIDKGMGSQVYQIQRSIAHTIAVPVVPDSQISVFQPAAYTMKDIAALERRIAALEYSVTLSKLEKSVSNLAIPSSINGAINRFKYGFFSDNFTSSAQSDLQNPEYKASIINNEVTAKTILNNLEFGYNLANSTTNSAVTGLFLTLPYTQAVLVSQNNATNGAIYIPPPAPPPPPPPPPNTPRGTLLSNYCGGTTGHDQYGVYADGNGGSYTQLIQANSLLCGYTPPPPPPSVYHGTLVSNPTSFTLITKSDVGTGGSTTTSVGTNSTTGTAALPSALQTQGFNVGSGYGGGSPNITNNLALFSGLTKFV